MVTGAERSEVDRLLSKQRLSVRRTEDLPPRADINLRLSANDADWLCGLLARASGLTSAREPETAQGLCVWWNRISDAIYESERHGTA